MRAVWEGIARDLPRPPAHLHIGAYPIPTALVRRLTELAECPVLVVKT